MDLLSWPGIAGKALRTEGNEEGGDEEGVEEEGSKSKCCTLYQQVVSVSLTVQLFIT